MSYKSILKSYNVRGSLNDDGDDKYAEINQFCSKQKDVNNVKETFKKSDSGTEISQFYSKDSYLSSNKNIENSLKKKKYLNDVTENPEEICRTLEKELLGKEHDVFDSILFSEYQDDCSKTKPSLQARWHDEDDDIVESFDKKRSTQNVKVKLQKRFNDIIGGNPEWAKKIKQDKSEDLLEDNDFSGKNLKRPKGLKTNKLEFDRVCDLNSEVGSDTIWNVVDFHPTSSAALIAGTAGVAYVVKVDGKTNKMLHNIKYVAFPIHCGGFSPDGNEFFVGSTNKNYIYVHNLETGTNVKVPLHGKGSKLDASKIYYSPDQKIMIVAGQEGYIHMFAAQSKELIDVMKMNSNLTGLAFNSNGNRMYTHGDTGELYEWDMHARKCLNKVYDSCRQGTAVGVSPNDDILVTGCDSGSVNIYRLPFTNSRTPDKIIQPVYTCVDQVRFNCSGDILAIASKYSTNSVKLIHCDTMTKFINFPMSNTNIYGPRLINFSPSSGYFTVCSGPRIQLYRLRYYSNY